MYDGNIVLLAFFLGMFFSLYAEQVIRSVVYAVVSFVMGLPTKRATDVRQARYFLDGGSCLPLVTQSVGRTLNRKKRKKWMNLKNG